jgi:hypothetical protein
LGQVFIVKPRLKNVDSGRPFTSALLAHLEHPPAASFLDQRRGQPRRHRELLRLFRRARDGALHPDIFSRRLEPNPFHFGLIEFELNDLRLEMRL